MERMYDYGISIEEIKNFSSVQNGLYFIGQVNQNPITLEAYYWVKVGQSSRVSRRISEYLKHAPMTYVADIIFMEDKEESLSAYERNKNSYLKDIKAEVCQAFDIEGKNNVSSNSTATTILEAICHSILESVCLSKGEKSREWFALSKEDYLDFCNNSDDFICRHCTQEQLKNIGMLLVETNCEPYSYKKVMSEIESW